MQKYCIERSLEPLQQKCLLHITFLQLLHWQETVIKPLLYQVKTIFYRKKNYFRISKIYVYIISISIRLEGQ